jgi:glycosidase
MKKTAVALMTLLAAGEPSTAPSGNQDQRPRFLSKEWLARAVIYEVNIRQATTEGTLTAFRKKHLARLDSLGVNILWLMPIHPIGIKERKGTLGSYYAVRDYRGVNPEYGTLDDLKQLVDSAHARGMAVILDWVANHTAADHPWTTEHPDWYTHDAKGNIIPPVADWHDTADLDYSSAGMREEMISSLEYWLKEAGIDGYRCDVAELVPLEFWRAVRHRLDAIKPVFMLAEGEKAELHQAFDMTYSWTFHKLMNGLAQGKQSATDVAKYWKDQARIYRRDDLRMQFITNHDENSWNGTEHERMGDARLASAVFSFTVKGMPLIYTGQEADLNKRLKFFEKDTIDWNGYVNASFYRKLTALKQSQRALDADGPSLRFLPTGNAHVVAFVRQRGRSQVVTFLNYSAGPVTLSVADTAFRGRYMNLFDGSPATVDRVFTVQLPAHGYRVEVRD